MNGFVDPRTTPTLSATRPPARTTVDSEVLEALHRLCRQGRLYDVERWAAVGVAGKYNPVPHTLIAALEAAYGYCVADLARAPQYDLRDALGIWIPPPMAVGPYRRLGCGGLYVLSSARRTVVFVVTD